MAHLTHAKLKVADARGRGMLATEPRAQAARYDRETVRVVVDLVNGCTYVFPAQLVQDLNGASPDALATIIVDSLAGQATPPAKAAAARSNGAKGGRPRKLSVSDDLAPRRC